MKKVLSVILSVSVLFGMVGFTTASAADGVAFTFEQNFETMAEDLTSAAFERESGLGHAALGGRAGQATYSIYNVSENENVNAVKIIPAATTFGEYGDSTRGNLNYKFPAPITSGNITATFKMRKEGFGGGVYTHKTGSFYDGTARLGGVCTGSGNNVKNLCEAGCQNNDTIIDNSIDSEQDGRIPTDAFGWNTLKATADWNAEGTQLTTSLYQYDYENAAWDLIITSSHAPAGGITYVSFGSFLAQDYEGDVGEDIAILFDDIKITTTQEMPSTTVISENFEDDVVGTFKLNEKTWNSQTIFSDYGAFSGGTNPNGLYRVGIDPDDENNKSVHMSTSGGGDWGDSGRVSLGYKFPTLIKKGEVSISYKIKYDEIRKEVKSIENCLGAFRTYSSAGCHKGTKLGGLTSAHFEEKWGLRLTGMPNAKGWYHFRFTASRDNESEPWIYKIYRLDSATPDTAIELTKEMIDEWKPVITTGEDTNPLYEFCFNATAIPDSQESGVFIDDIEITLPHELKLENTEMVYYGTGGYERVVSGLKVNGESGAAIRWFDAKNDTFVKCIDTGEILPINGTNQHPGADHSGNATTNDETDNSGSMCIMMEAGEKFASDKQYVLNYCGLESEPFYGHYNTYVAVPVIEWSTVNSAEGKIVTASAEIYGMKPVIPIIALYNNGVLVGTNVGNSITPSTIRTVKAEVSAKTTENVTGAKLFFFDTASTIKPMRAVEVLSSASFQ